MNEELCPICLSKLNEKTTYKIECNHTFHTDCIMKWFRQSNGSCPCCMDNPTNNSKLFTPVYYGFWNIKFIEKRCNAIKRFSKKQPNKSLTNNFYKLRKYEEELKQLKQDKKDHLNNETVKEIKLKEKEINTKTIRKDKQIKKLKVTIVSKYPTIQTS
jgi:hypothetical protein